MLKHFIKKHREEKVKKMAFKMKILQFTRMAFEQQITESVVIRNKMRHHISNSKSDFDR